MTFDTAAIGRAARTRFGVVVALLLIALVAHAAGLRHAAAIAALGSALVGAEETRRAGVWRHALTPLGAFTWMYVPLTLGGMAWLYARGETSPTSFAVILITFLAVHAGAWLARDRNVMALASTRPVDRATVPGFIALTAGLLAITAFAVVIRPTIPLFELLTHPGDFLANNEWRFEYTTGTPGYTYLSQAFGNGLPFVSVFAFLAALVMRSRRWAIVTAGLIGATALVLVLSTQRGPVLWFLLLFVLAADAKAVRVDLRRIALYGGAVAVVMFGVLAFRTVGSEGPINDSIGAAVAGALDRLFLVQNRVADFVVDLPFGGGAYLASDFLALRPGPDLGFSAHVFNQLLPGSAIQGTAPSIFTAQLFADFWWPGVIVGGMILGAALAFVEGLLRRTDSVVTVTLVVTLTLALARLQQVDLVSATFDFGIIAYLTCYAFLIAAARLAKHSQSPRQTLPLADPAAPRATGKPTRG